MSTFFVDMMTLSMHKYCEDHGEVNNVFTLETLKVLLS